MKKNTVKKGIVLGGALAALGVGKLFQDLICRQENVKHEIKDATGVESESDRQRLWRESNEWLNERGSELVSIQSFDGLKLVGEFFEGEGVPGSTVLLVHGYHSSRRGEYAAIAKFFLQAGYNILMVDDRAHGESEGKYVGFGCLDREDCYRWAQYLDKRFQGEQNLFLFGISMGAATVLMASSMNLPVSVKGIVGDCGFTSPMEECVHVMNQKIHGITDGLLSRITMSAVSFVCKQKAGYGLADYSSAKCVAETKLPIFIIHGDKDDFVPTSMGKEIYEACASKKELWLPEGAGHAESYYLHREEYEHRVLKFFENCLIGECDED